MWSALKGLANRGAERCPGVPDLAQNGGVEHAGVVTRHVRIGVSEHLGDALHRHTAGKHTSGESMPCKVENTYHLRIWKNIENKLITCCEVVDFLYFASMIGKQFNTEY